MGGIVGAEKGCPMKLHPDGCHVGMNHALQPPLEAFHHGTSDVIVLTGEEVNVTGPVQLLDGCCMHFSLLVALHSQWW